MLWRGVKGGGKGTDRKWERMRKVKKKREGEEEERGDEGKDEERKVGRIKIEGE